MSDFHRTKEWSRFVRQVRPVIEASLPQPCVNGAGRCWIMPGQAFHVAHIMDAALYPDLALDRNNVGPACSAHNLADGGRAGARKTNLLRKRRTEGEFPRW